MLTISELRDRAVIRPIKRAAEDDLLDLPGVTAVDIGEKRRAGRGTGAQAVVVSVARKRDLSDVPVGERVPAEISGVVTDVIEEEPVLWHIHCTRDQALTWPPAQRPDSLGALSGRGVTPARTARLFMPQVPVADEYHRIGTLGPLVLSEGSALGLTTFDVACLDDAWSVGDAMVDPLHGRTCGELDRAALSGRVDAAAVGLAGAEADALLPDPGAADGGQAGPARAERGATTAFPGGRVCKVGFGTGLTRGVVTSVDASVRVDHGDALGVRVLREQLRITGTGRLYCGAGDAGAAVLDPLGRVAGLHVAGSCTGRVGFASPISEVLAELDVRLCLAGARVGA
ncbi:chymotrypsin family serine protease [Salinifilum ghardaiensis]